MTVDALEAIEVASTLITNKKYKKKNKASSFPFMSFSNSKSKILLILWASSLSKAITTHYGLVIVSSLTIIASKTIKLQITPFSVFLPSKSKLKVNLFA